MGNSAKNVIKNYYKSLKAKGSFAQNITLTLSGNAIAIGLGFLFTPFIARIYSPEAYGVFAFFIAVTQNLGNITTLQFTRAYVLPKGEKEFFALIKITLLSTIFFTLLSIIILLLFSEKIAETFNIKILDNWLLFVPVGLLFLSFNDILRSWNIRIKEFGRGAVTKIISTLFAKSIALIYGIITFGSVQGLIISDLLSKPIDSFYALNKRNRKRIPLLFKDYNYRYLTKIFIKFQAYPLFVLPNNWLNSLANQIPVFLLISFFDSSVTGNYSLANSLLNIPGTILSAAIAPVFLQKAAETFREDPEKLPKLVHKLYNRLFYLGIIPLSILIVFGDYIFYFFLGSSWTLAGEFARYIGIYFAFWMISSALSSLFRIYQKEKLNLYITILSLILKTLGLIIGIYFDDYLLSIILFSFGSLLGHLIQCIFLLNFVRLSPYKILLKSFACFVSLILLMLVFKSSLNLFVK